MSQKILIVDDEEEIVQLLAIRLKFFGYEIRTALTVEDALRSVNEEKPDLIIMDIKMPSGGGAAICEKLKSSPDTNTIPVILASALPPQDIQGLVRECEVTDYICKPFESKDILGKIKRILGE